MYSLIHFSIINSEENLDRLLLTLEDTNAFDDVYISNESSVVVKAENKIFSVGNRGISDNEMRFIVNHIYRGENGYGEIMRGNELDASYEIVSPKGFRYRYRVNIVAIRGSGNKGAVRVTMRSIKSIPLSFSQLGIEQEIIDGFRPKQGMVLLVGSTGSGKSTLLSAAIKDILEDEDSHCVVCEYSAPIESTYHDIKKPSSVIFQSEIGRDIKSFALGVRNALRSNPDVIVVGEARDRETIEAATMASLTGHLVYTTSHANSPPEALRRMVMAFDKSERASRQADLVSSFRLVVVQRLVSKVGGGRVGLRGWIVMDEESRSELMSANPETIAVEFKKLIQRKGNPLLASAKKALDKGLISQIDFNAIKAGES